MFGLCQGGFGCKRVHICERFLNRDCRCSRNHNFRAAQPLIALQGVPECLVHSLKSAYANMQAVRYQDNKDKHGGDSETEAPWRQPGIKLADIDAGSSNSQNKAQKPEETSDARGERHGSQQRKRSRRRRSHRGNWSSHQERADSMDDLRMTFNVLELMGFDG